MTTYAHDYFDALARLLGRTEDRRSRVMSAAPADGMPPVYALFYDHWPQPGILTAFTLGGGLGLHADQVDAHVELVLSLATTDMRWGLAAAHLVENCRAHDVIDVGTTLDMGEPLSIESPMSAFLVTEPHHWSAPPRLRVGERTVTLFEAHPIYPSELERFRQGGREQLQQRLLGPTYDPKRPPVVRGD
jgi:hypothetical protein